MSYIVNLPWKLRWFEHSSPMAAVENLLLKFKTKQNSLKYTRSHHTGNLFLWLQADIYADVLKTVNWNFHFQICSHSAGLCLLVWVWTFPIMLSWFTLGFKMSFSKNSGKEEHGPGLWDMTGCISGKSRNELPHLCSPLHSVIYFW